MNELRQQLRCFIVEHFLFGEDDGIADNTSLLEQGVLDSTGVMELVTHLESSYGLTVANEEVIPENLDSIESLAEFIERKKSRTQGRDES